uniref:Uncharacterized protein n=1 Tax=Anguilla anguilla TaxID=7936 RepID=A0A0E9RQX1_ANGAN
MFLTEHPNAAVTITTGN